MRELKGTEETLLGCKFRRLILSDFEKRHPVGPKFSNLLAAVSNTANKVHYS
jgi:hypothetical protein